MEEHNIDYFIDFFSTVPSKHFSLSSDAAELDAYNWLDTVEQNALFHLVKGWGSLTDANDGRDDYDVFGKTIKERVIGFLIYVKDKRSLYCS